MELTTLKLLFAGGVLAIAAAIVLLLLAIQRLGDWLKSPGEQVMIRPPSGTSGRAPDPAREQGLRLPSLRSPSMTKISSLPR